MMIFITINHQTYRSPQGITPEANCMALYGPVLHSLGCHVVSYGLMPSVAQRPLRDPPSSKSIRINTNQYDLLIGDTLRTTHHVSLKVPPLALHHTVAPHSYDTIIVIHSFNLKVILFASCCPAGLPSLGDFE